MFTAFFKHLKMEKRRQQENHTNLTRSWRQTTHKSKCLNSSRSKDLSPKCSKGSMPQSLHMVKRVQARLSLWKGTSMKRKRRTSALGNRLLTVWTREWQSGRFMRYSYRLKKLAKRKPLPSVSLSYRSTMRRFTICSTELSLKTSVSWTRVWKSDGVKRSNSQSKTCLFSAVTTLSMQFRCTTKESRTRLSHLITWTIHPVAPTPCSPSRSKSPRTVPLITRLLASCS